MSFNLTTSYAIQAKAGIGAVATSGALLALACDLAEGNFMVKTRHNWIADIATNQISYAISEAVSSLAANKIICQDLSGYFSRAEAQTLIDFNDNTAREITELLEEEKYREKLGITS